MLIFSLIWNDFKTKLLALRLAHDHWLLLLWAHTNGQNVNEPAAVCVFSLSASVIYICSFWQSSSQWKSYFLTALPLCSIIAFFPWKSSWFECSETCDTLPTVMKDERGWRDAREEKGLIQCLEKHEGLSRQLRIELYKGKLVSSLTAHLDALTHFSDTHSFYNYGHVL